MNYLTEMLKQADALKANQILVSTLKPLSFKVGGRWRTPLDQIVLKPAELRSLILELLPEGKKQELLAKDEVNFQFSLAERRVLAQILNTHQGLLANFSWQESSKNEAEHWAPPQLAVEVLNKARGLSLVVGGQDSGRTHCVSELIRQYAVDKTVFIFSDGDLKGAIAGQVWAFDIDKIQSPIVQEVVPDLIVIESSQDGPSRQAVELAEIGYRVLLVSHANNAIAAIERLLDRMGGDRDIASRRLGRIFQMLLAIKLVPAIDEPAVPIFDLLLGNEEVRQLIKAGQVEELDKCKHTNFNQSLFNHILRRRVDLKVSFEESPSPTELDQMLKKVGI